MTKSTITVLYRVATLATSVLFVRSCSAARQVTSALTFSSVNQYTTIAAALFRSRGFTNGLMLIENKSVLVYCNLVLWLVQLQWKTDSFP